QAAQDRSDRLSLADPAIHRSRSKGAYAAAIGTILGACILLGKIAIGDWLTVLVALGSLAVLFRFKVSNPLLVAATAVVVAIGGAVMPPISTAQNATTQIDISRMNLGLAPDDFTFWRTGEGEAGQWSVVADPTAANGRAIAQVSKDRTDYRFPLAIYKPYSGKDLEVSVRFKAVAGTVDEAGGVAVRLLTPGDYYIARANALEDNVRFYRVVKGKREQLAGANLKVSANAWHTLALRAEGDRFTVSF